jgi:hypothetical protein
MAGKDDCIVVIFVMCWCRLRECVEVRALAGEQDQEASESGGATL